MCTSSNQFTVTISGNNGVSKTQNNYSGNSFTIPASSFSDGTYSVKISNGKINETRQLTIKR
ncbi:MAG: T9SS type A sorting domain-containing protein [Bacteroidales bacterium]|nr:T9SS type A sorting domain-containing protein [Bacteroidales bacterium]